MVVRAEIHFQVIYYITIVNKKVFPLFLLIKSARIGDLHLYNLLRYGHAKKQELAILLIVKVGTSVSLSSSFSRAREKANYFNGLKFLLKVLDTSREAGESRTGFTSVFT
jgi:hypothetical protein